MKRVGGCLGRKYDFLKFGLKSRYDFGRERENKVIQAKILRDKKCRVAYTGEGVSQKSRQEVFIDMLGRGVRLAQSGKVLTAWPICLGFVNCG